MPRAVGRNAILWPGDDERRAQEASRQAGLLERSAQRFGEVVGRRKRALVEEVKLERQIAIRRRGAGEPRQRSERLRGALIGCKSGGNPNAGGAVVVLSGGARQARVLTCPHLLQGPKAVVAAQQRLHQMGLMLWIGGAHARDQPGGQRVWAVDEPLHQRLALLARHAGEPIDVRFGLRVRR